MNFQYEYFFENAELPTVREQLEQPIESVPRTQTSLLLDNVAKIECEFNRLVWRLHSNR